MRRTQRFVFTVWMKIKRSVCVYRLCVMTVWWLCPASHYQRKRHAVQKVKKMIHITSADSRQTKKLWSIFKVTANEEIIHGASVCTRGENESCWGKRSTFLWTCWFSFWCFTAKPHKTTNFVFGTDSKETRAQHRPGSHLVSTSVLSDPITGGRSEFRCERTQRRAELTSFLLWSDRSERMWTSSPCPSFSWSRTLSPLWIC